MSEAKLGGVPVQKYMYEQAMEDAMRKLAYWYPQPFYYIWCMAPRSQSTYLWVSDVENTVHKMDLCHQWKEFYRSAKHTTATWRSPKYSFLAQAVMGLSEMIQWK